ncbi:alpha-amylase [Synechococcus sp. BSF8S]|uniref:alpha-amylase family protein n=1 Tax=Synechococcales TaxID=1890424 RepID=UPI001626F3E8|nr:MULTISPECIES: alpha-amylase family protein [unclassified Synechococcus]MBC1260593.1 alpha-amylase [Synechococcus sp. BSF8S]MBC1263243.1 alpha-amylase [Synechococcus sp. BSA11S]
MTRRSPVARRASLAFSIAGLLLSLPAESRADVILHAFDWSYADIAERAEAIAAVGYKAVLVTPPLKSPKTTSCEWWLRYQPQDFRVIDHCDGNRESLVQAIQALDLRGVKTYADVVVNHMANERMAATSFPGEEILRAYSEDKPYWSRQILYGDSNGDGILDNGYLPDDGTPDGLFGPQDFHPRACIRDYGNRFSVIRDRICGPDPDPGLPDLIDTDPTRTWVQDQRKRYVQALYDLGIRGFRIDAAKHMPNGAIRSFVPEEVARNSHVFAEIITSGGATSSDYQQYLEPYLRELPSEFGAYDFPLFNALRQAFSFSRPLSDVAFPYSSGDALANSRAVTVVVTHDIPYNEVFRSLIFDQDAESSVDEDLAYVYIMGRDGGTPLVFDDQSDGRSNNSRWRDVWNSDRMGRMIAFHNRMQGKPMEVMAADACTLLWRRQEDGIVAINKCGEQRSITVDTRFKFRWNHPYRDMLTDTLLPEIKGPSYTFHLPARSARMWYAVGSSTSLHHSGDDLGGETHRGLAVGRDRPIGEWRH